MVQHDQSWESALLPIKGMRITEFVIQIPPAAWHLLGGAPVRLEQDSKV